MGKKYTGWIADVRPLPAKRVLWPILVLTTLVMILTDSVLPAGDLNTPEEWAELLLPYVPVLALAFGAIPGALTWLITVGLLLMLGGSLTPLVRMMVPTLVVLVLCAYLLPWKQALVFSGLAILSLPVFLIVNPGELRLQGIFIDGVYYLAAALIGLSLNRYRSRQQRSDERIQTLEEQQALIRQEERTRLAHELHDIVAHEVTIIAMQAQRAGLTSDPEKTAQVLEGIGTSAKQALSDLRTLVLLLKEDESASGQDQPDAESRNLLDTPATSGETTTAVGFLEDLNNVVTALREAGFTVDFAVDGELSRIPTSQRQAFRRTARELGTNVLKHASTAGPVEIQLSVDDSWVTLQSSNEVSGAKPIMSTRTGIEAMRSRAEVFGGVVESGESGGRWSTKMMIPLERQS